MSGTISVNTNKLYETAMNLQAINSQIDSDFEAVNFAVSRMNASWDGAAGNSAESEFNKIRNECFGSNGRRAVMNNYINFLSSDVATNYEMTENTNSQLSSLFK